MDEVGKDTGILSHKPLGSSEMTPQSFIPDRSAEAQHEYPFRLTMRYEKHQVKPENYTQQQAELYERLHGAFRKGETNIFFSEESRETKYGNDKDRFVEYFNKGFTKYHSFIKAYIYTQPAYVDPTSDSITDQDYEDAMKTIEGVKRDDPPRAYRIMVYEALDRLLAEGYDIQIMFEHGYPKVVSQPAKTLDDVKQQVMQEAERSNNRERSIVNQITFIERLAPEMKQRVNLFALLGTLHSNMVKLFPEELRDNMAASSENLHDEITDSMTARILKKLHAGRQVSETQWKELGKQWPGVEGIE